VTQQLAQTLKLPAGTQGVRITRVHPDSVAQKAGFKVGDIITRLDTDKVEASQPEDNEVFAAMVRQYRIGSAVRVWMIRGGKAMSIPITLPRAPKQERELSVYRDENFGVSLRDVTYNDRLKGDAKRDANGAKVTNVQSGSWGALAGLKQGDIITQIDGTTVKNTDEAKAKLSALEKSRARNVVFFVTRGVRTLYVEAQTDWSVQDDSSKIAGSQTVKENA
jgi:S1-C subfamily serine protease